MERFKAGEAPWEKENKKESFKAGQAPWEQEEELGIGSQVLDKGLRALDYLGGFGRMAASGYADLYNLATGQPTIGKTEDLERALVGKAPDTEEYLDRSGMEDGVARKVLGFAGDIALDPTTYMTFGMSAVGKGGKAAKTAKRLLNPVSTVAEPIGNKMTRSSVKQIDEALEISGKGKLSDLMLKHNIAGTNKTIRKKVDKLSKKFSKERKKMYKEVDKAGGKVDTSDLVEDFGNYTSQFRTKTGNQISDDVAKGLEEQFFNALPKDKYGNYLKEIPLQQASNIKTQLRKNLPNNFYDGLGRVKDEYKQGVDTLAGVFQRNIENAANKTIPGMGDNIATKNKEWSILLDADSPLGREARKAAGKNFITSIDAMILGAAAKGGTESLRNLAVFGAKKAGDISKTTVFRTRGGQFVRGAGRSGDVITRRSLINMGREDEQ